MNENQVEEFIDEVESRPAIWDSRSDKYSNKIEKKKAWEEICNKFIENFTNKTASEKNEACKYIFNTTALYFHHLP